MSRQLKFIIWLLLVLLAAVLVLADIKFVSETFWRLAWPLVLAIILCVIRITLGPTPADRVMSIDILGILIIGICGLLALVTGRDMFLDIAIAWALQSFISTLALAKYLEGKSFDD